jgi:histone-lysine N-methyltransferase SETMAR
MAAGDWWFHWDNAPIHTADMVTDWMAHREFQVIKHLPYSPDLTPANFFLFPKVKRELAVLTLTKETFKKEWEGADFTIAFRRWYERCEKCIDIAGSYVEKS